MYGGPPPKVLSDDDLPTVSAEERFTRAEAEALLGVAVVRDLQRSETLTRREVEAAACEAGVSADAIRGALADRKREQLQAAAAKTSRRYLTNAIGGLLFLLTVLLGTAGDWVHQSLATRYDAVVARRQAMWIAYAQRGYIPAPHEIVKDGAAVAARSAAVERQIQDSRRAYDLAAWRYNDQALGWFPSLVCGLTTLPPRVPLARALWPGER